MNSNSKKDKRFGEILKDLRMEKRFSLREFCRLLKIDSSNISKIERGKMNPPQSREMIERYAEILGIRDDEEKWTEFYQAACLENRIIPEDIPGGNILIPAFFGIISGEKATEEELERLIKLINEA